MQGANLCQACVLSGIVCRSVRRLHGPIYLLGSWTFGLEYEPEYRFILQVDVFHRKCIPCRTSESRSQAQMWTLNLNFHRKFLPCLEISLGNRGNWTLAPGVEGGPVWCWSKAVWRGSYWRTPSYLPSAGQSSRRSSLLGTNSKLPDPCRSSLPSSVSNMRNTKQLVEGSNILDLDVSFREYVDEDVSVELWRLDQRVLAESHRRYRGHEAELRSYWCSSSTKFPNNNGSNRAVRSDSNRPSYTVPNFVKNYRFSVKISLKKSKNVPSNRSS